MSWEYLFGNWKDVNVQPSRSSEKQSVCPSYNIIELCAELAGTPPEKFSKEPEFCGVKKQLTIGEPTGWPKAACWEIQKKLSIQLAIAQGAPVKTETESSIQKELRGESSLDEKLKLIQTYQNESQKKLEQENILKRFREVVFDSCYVHKGDDAERNPHLRAISSADDLSKKEILGHVKTFLNALSKITGRTYDHDPKLLTIGEITHPANNCRQCPSYESHPFWGGDLDD